MDVQTLVNTPFIRIRVSIFVCLDVRKRRTFDEITYSAN